MRRMLLRVLEVGLLVLVLACFSGCAKKTSSELAGEGGISTAPAYETSDVAIKPESGKLNGNKLVFGDDLDGKAVKFVYGAFTDGHGEVSGNKLTIAGGVITDSAYGAYTEGWAKNNKVLVTGGQIRSRVEGGHGRQGSQGNELIFAGGSVENAYGGYSSDGSADNNRLVVRGGTITDDAQGGLSLGSSAAGNTLVIEGGVIGDQAYGGYGMEGPATGNTTIVSGGVVKGDVQGAVSSTHAATGNTLILRGEPQIGGSAYGAFAVGEHGDEPDDVTGNKILLEGFRGALGDIWNAEQMNIDRNSRLANRESVLNVYNCRQLKNDGAIVFGESAQVYLEIGKYSGKGMFELETSSSIYIKGAALEAPLRIKIIASEPLRAFAAFDQVTLVELKGGKFGKGLTADNAVQLLNNKVGDLTLHLRHEERGGDHSWILSGK